MKGQRNPHAGMPFESDDATIAAMLDEVSIPALMCSLVHMTGDPSWVRGTSRPKLLTSMDVQGGMAADTRAQVRARALPAIAGYRDGGCEPQMPPPAVVSEMMEFLACNTVEPERAQMMIEELQLDGADARAVTWRDEIPAAVRDASPVVVIGCGESGIVAAIRLAQAGLPFTIVEKLDGPGGTWRHNRYPGARVDVGSHHYSYSFEPSETWSEYFCRQPELQAYFEGVVERYGLAPHCRFNTEVISASWDDGTARWKVTTRDAAGAEVTLEARFVIGAVGALSVPRVPDFPGMATFAGTSFHSAQWPLDLDHRDTRFALIGAGASGFQIAPTIADDVEHLTIFQRTAQWVLPNAMYHAAVPPGDAWAMRHLPFYGRWYRFMMMYPGISIGTTPFRRDPAFESAQAVNAGNAQRRVQLTAWIESQLAGRPDLIEKSVPDYPPAGKRILQDNGSWYGCLTKPNVDFLRCGVERIVPEGVVDTEGILHEADVICFATGFHANDYFAPIEVTGRGGISIRDQWGDRPSGLLGITVPNFPNLFMLYGPGTNLAHGASIILHSECQVRYTLEVIRLALQVDARAIEVRKDAHDEYTQRYRAEIDQLIWSHESIEHSHYKNPEGKIYTLSPWPIEQYWAWTHEADVTDYTLTP